MTIWACLLWACREVEVPGSVPLEPIVADPPLPEPPATCASAVDVSEGTLLAGWISSEGVLYGVGRSPHARVRAADGTWSLDPAAPALTGAVGVHGVGDAVWAVAPGAVLRRQPDGEWVDMAAPFPTHATWEGVAIRALAPDEVRVLTIEEGGSGGHDWQHARVFGWDGAAWSVTDLGFADVVLPALLPHGEVVVLDYYALGVLGRGDTWLPGWFEQDPFMATEDGTLVLADWRSKLFWVDTEAGFVQTPFPFDADR